MESLSIPSPGLIYLDSNAVIYLVEKVEPQFTLLNPLWSGSSHTHRKVVSSELTLHEVLSKPFKNGDLELERLFRKFLPSTLSLVFTSG